MLEHLERHYFYIAHEQFSCYYDMEFKKQPYWYADEALDSIWEIDKDKGFRTKEACEKYMRKQVRNICKLLLKDVR